MNVIWLFDIVVTVVCNDSDFTANHANNTNKSVSVLLFMTEPASVYHKLYNQETI